MALPNDITLEAKTFSRTITGRSNGTWSNPDVNISQPETLFVSHETTKSGRRNSVISINYAYDVNCDDACVIAPLSRVAKAQFKLSYNPLDLNKVDLAAMRDECIAAVTLQWDKILNLEA